MSLNYQNGDLLQAIEENYITARKTRNQIKQIRATKDLASSENCDSLSLFKPERIVVEEPNILEENRQLDDEVGFYLDDFMSLRGNFTVEDLISVLPSKNNVFYEKILSRLKIEMFRVIKEYSDFIHTEDLDAQDLLDCGDVIECSYKKINMIQDIMSMEEETSVDDSKSNTIVLMPSLYGNIVVIEEISRIAPEYYFGFLNLLNSIVDGSFKGMKYLSNSSFSGIYEVKDLSSDTRVLFSRIGKDTYVIISAFVKKVNSVNSIYRENLNQKIDTFIKQKQKLLNLINTSEFMEENSKYVDELYRILSPKTEAKLYAKEGEE